MAITKVQSLEKEGTPVLFLTLGKTLEELRHMTY